MQVTTGSWLDVNLKKEVQSNERPKGKATPFEISETVVLTTSYLFS